jgi:FO synthase
MFSEAELRKLVHEPSAERLAAHATAAGHLELGPLVSYSRKVFIPLTRLCRDVCHYCTFATTPRHLKAPYLDADEVLEIARAGQRAGCREALFTLGDKPELRWPEARAFLDRLGHASTIDYLVAMCRRVIDETGLLPHANPGVLSRDELARLREVSVSQGLMLESAAARLCEHGGPHHGSPDKHPAVRLETIRLAGELAIPFTSGILIGIGETREERLDALLALRALHEQHGHLQEIIVQNFRAKPATPMARAAEPELEDLAWTVALARLVFGPAMSIQAPPNLSPHTYPRLIAAGLNDWGGVSPVTPDHVNPEAAWPEVASLRSRTAAAGKILVERVASYPAYALEPARWQDAGMVPHLLRHIDAEGLARGDAWNAGVSAAIPSLAAPPRRASADLEAVISRAQKAEPLDENDLVRLFAARGDEVAAVCRAADGMRRETSGDTVRYVVNRNINYTNVCHYGCTFCAFSKGRHGNAIQELRGAPYDLDHAEIARRVAEAWSRGATEVCMQGGIHPAYTGETYLEILRTVKLAAPAMHVHAFSPLEVAHGAATLGLPVEAYLERLRAAGLGTLPGTAAEVLDDEIRRIICPDKIGTDEWLAVMRAAHRVGLRSTATVLFGHIESTRHLARHLMRIRALQAETGGFTEFVPLPFIHMEAPMYLKGRSRKGPTWREVLLMHAVARLALHPLLTNIQVSWVKLGPEGALAVLQAGANDLGGTLMNESISRAAGTTHGQELAPAHLDLLIARAGRIPVQRTTLYGTPVEGQRARSYRAPELAPIVLTPVQRRRRDAAPEAATS